MGKDTEFSFYKNIYSEGCPGCDREEPQPEGLAIVFQNRSFRVHQDYALPIPGMMVIESKKHTKSYIDFTEKERTDFDEALFTTLSALKEVGFEEVIRVQEERSSHFHEWLMPIYPWMKTATEGKLRNLQDIFDYTKANLINPNQIAEVEKATKQIINVINTIND